MEDYKMIIAGIVGSVITLLLTAILDYLKEIHHNRIELKKILFQRKLEVVEKAMSWYQEALDMYYMLQTALKEYDKDCNPITVQKIQVACMKSNKLFQEAESRLNSIYLYYDFSDIEKKYHGRDSMECINKLLTLVAEIGHKIATVEPSEFAEQLCAALHEQRIEAFHMLADSLNNQIYIIAEIGQRLRDEYKSYLK